MVLEMLAAGGPGMVSRIATKCQVAFTAAFSAKAIWSQADLPPIRSAPQGRCAEFLHFLAVELLPVDTLQTVSELALNPEAPKPLNP